MSQAIKIKRALISVSDKTEVLELAQALHALGVEILSTGGTAQLLKSNQVPVIEISDYTGFAEMMDGRLKTLHPKIHGGILGRRDIDKDAMQEHAISEIDLVVVNLYPFAQTIKQPDVTLAKAIENIDIGGPTMIRAAAKNHQWCTVVTDNRDYASILDELEQNKGISYETRFKLAKKAFSHTAEYDGYISNYLTSLDDAQKAQSFSKTLNLQFELKEVLRYGENPHQQAGVYTNTRQQDEIEISQQLQGKSLSYNNILDANAALTLVKQFDQCACVIVKHNNPCGVALGGNPMQAYERAFKADPQSAFGGIVAFNKQVDENLMSKILGNQFVEVIIAPKFSSVALEVAQTKPNCRLISYNPDAPQQTNWQYKSIEGGLLVQSQPLCKEPAIEVVTEHQIDDKLLKDCQFAWQVCKAVKSNAIVLAKDEQTIGIGAGQTSRIFSLEIASLRAKQNNLETQGAVLASDAFFPFKDNVEKAHEAGIKAIIQTGGSKRDKEVIDCANELGISMIFTHMRYFLH